MKSGKLFHMEWFAQILDHHLDSTKMPYNVKLEVQDNVSEVNVA